MVSLGIVLGISLAVVSPENSSRCRGDTKTAPAEAKAASAQSRSTSTKATDVWLVSTRGLSGDSCSADASPDFWRLSDAADWNEADQASFLKADSATIPTVFLVHGNRYDADDAIAKGLNFCEELKSLTPVPRFRLVIWSWPSDRISLRPRPDVAAKNVRSQQEAAYLARLLDRMHPDTPVSLVGFSYGAQTIVGTLKLLAGNCYAGCVLPRRATPRRAPLRGILAAAATENHALDAVDSEHSPLESVDRLLLAYNSSDRVLRYYPCMGHPRGPAALGFAGPASVDPDDPNWNKVEILDLACEVGPAHDWDLTCKAESFESRVAFYALFASPKGAGTAEADRQ